MSVHALAIAKQSAKGTAATAAAYRIPLVSGTAKPRRAGDRLADITASPIQGIPYTSLVGAEGNPEYALRVEMDAIGLLLYLMLGSQAVSGAGDPYTHTLTESTTRPYLTIWRMFEDLLWEKFIDCKIGQLVLTSEKGAPVRVAMTIDGLEAHSLTSVTFASEVAVAEPSSAPVMHYDGAGTFQVEGAVVSTIERIVTTINRNNSVEQGDNIRGYEVYDGNLEATVETTQALSEVALYNRFHYGTAAPTTGTTGTRNRTSLTGGVDFLWTPQATPERSLRLQMPSLDVSAVAGYEPTTGRTAPKRTSTYELLRPASGAAITAVVKNAVAAAY